MTVPTPCLSTLMAVAITASASAASVWINEFHYDDDGTDANEFVEIFVSNAFGGSLSDISLLLYNGSDDELYGSADTFVVADDFVEGDTVAGQGVFYSITLPSNGLQNGGPDGMVLWDTNANALLDGLSYEGSMGPLGDGPAAGISLPDIGVSEISTTAENSSLYRTDSGGSPVWAVGDGSNTKGSLNVGQSIPEPSIVLLGGLGLLGLIRRRR
jgi:hypothetical protein